MIQTYPIIIAATLNTMKISMGATVLFRCGKTGYLLGFALQKLRGSLRQTPAPGAVLPKRCCKCTRELSRV